MKIFLISHGIISKRNMVHATFKIALIKPKKYVQLENHPKNQKCNLVVWSRCSMLPFRPWVYHYHGFGSIFHSIKTLKIERSQSGFNIVHRPLTYMTPSEGWQLKRRPFSAWKVPKNWKKGSKMAFPPFFVVWWKGNFRPKLGFWPLFLDAKSTQEKNQPFRVAFASFWLESPFQIFFCNFRCTVKAV